MRRTLIALFAAAALATPAVAQQQDPKPNTNQSPGQNQNTGQNTGQPGQSTEQSGQEHSGQPVHLSRSQIRMLQQGLNTHGLNAGPVDGIMGDRTRQALQKFQSAHGLNASGDMDRKTLAALMAERNRTAKAGMSHRTASHKGSRHGM